MPWEYLLGSAASGAGTVLILVLLFWKKLVERSLDSAFDVRLEKLKSELLKNLETSKSELGVWARLRNEVLVEIWTAHRLIMSEMSDVILKVQEITAEQVDFHTDSPAPLQSFETALEPSVEKYRATIHRQFHVLDPMIVNDICQRFLMKSYEMYTQGPVEYEFTLKVTNELKGIRYEFQRYVVGHFGLEKMMPWMASNNSGGDK